MRTLATLLAVLLTGACGTSAGSNLATGVDGPGTFVLDHEELGGCAGVAAPLPPPKDVDAFLARPGAWVRVERIDAAGAGDAITAFNGRYVVAGGDRAHVARLGNAAFGTLTMHGTTATAAARALELGATVTARTGRDGDARSVSYAIATHGAQEVAYLGECANNRLTRKAGGPTDRHVRAIVGKPSAEVKRLLAMNQIEIEWETTPLAQRALAPGTAPNSVMRRLGSGMVTVDVPDSWRGGHMLCTRVALGSTECLALRDVRPDSPGIGFFYDPRDPVLYLDLLGAEPDARRLLLARVDLGALARARRVDLATKPSLGLRVTLRPSPSLAAVLADPARARDAVVVSGLTLP